MRRMDWAVNDAIKRLDINCFTLMLKYKGHECFWEPDPAARTFGGVLDTDRFAASTICGRFSLGGCSTPKLGV